MMVAISYYIYYTAQRRWGTHWHKWGPTYLTITAGLLIMSDQMRHVLQDSGDWPAGPWPGSSEYRTDCHEETFACLSVVGWLFTVVFTYSGFALLMLGTLWNANIVDKLDEIRTKWREIQGKGQVENANGEL